MEKYKIKRVIITENGVVIKDDVYVGQHISFPVGVVVEIIKGLQDAIKN